VPTPIAVDLDGVRGAVLERSREARSAGALLGNLLGRPWRTAHLRQARLLFHLERHGIPAAELLAFGQKATGLASCRSFLLYRPDPAAVPLAADEWRTAAAPVGDLVRRLHDAGCALRHGTGACHPPFDRRVSGGLVVASPRDVVYRRRVSRRRRRRDAVAVAAWLVAHGGRTSAVRFLRAYFATRRLGGDARAVLAAALGQGGRP
jgi:hypothetical protein